MKHSINPHDQRTLCGLDPSGLELAQALFDATCPRCLDSARPEHVVHLSVGETPHPLCGAQGTVTSDVMDVNCGVCLEAHPSSSGPDEPDDTLINATNPFDSVKITHNGSRVTVERGGTISVSDFPTREESFAFYADFTGWLRAQGFRPVVQTRVLPSQQAAASVAFGNAMELLREWFGWWKEDPNSPVKLPNSLHTRTAGYLAVCDKG